MTTNQRKSYNGLRMYAIGSDIMFFLEYDRLKNNLIIN